jgi:putative spermidine/putrescine transport system permease protein
VTLSPRAKAALGAATALGFAFVYVPRLVVLVNSVNASRTFGWPP